MTSTGRGATIAEITTTTTMPVTGTEGQITAEGTIAKKSMTVTGKEVTMADTSTRGTTTVTGTDGPVAEASTSNKTDGPKTGTNNDSSITIKVTGTYDLLTEPDTGDTMPDTEAKNSK